MQALGRSRDMKVLAGLEKFRYLNTPQIAELYFQSVKDPSQRIKKASERMKIMFTRGYVQRFRFPGEPFIFTTKGNKYSSKIQHYMMIANCWIALQKLKSGSVISCEVEVQQENVITDLIVNYKNNFRNEEKIYWLEVENNSSGDIFEKIEKYEGLQWILRQEKKQEGILCIVAGKDSTLRKLEACKNGKTFRVYSYQTFEQDWKW